ncbi:MAG: CGCGG family rSAM-modified RiPP protein [Halodesulfurarchaeum sp.]
MTDQTSSHEEAHGESEPVTDHVHSNSWSANLEASQYGDDLDLLERHAIEAVEKTEPGYHVNLVTHENHGHPETYLFDVLEEQFGGDGISWEYIDQCGCGGHVVRVTVQ